MRRLITSLCVALSLVACAPTINSAGSQAVAIADYLYVAGEKSGEALVAQGLMDRATFKADARVAYQVLLAVRAGKATVDQLIAALAPLKGKTP